jgi:hypothetical protein
MTDKEFVRYIPRCEGCGEAFWPSMGPANMVGVSFLEDRNGRREVVEDNQYHPKCAPLQANGQPYQAGAITFVFRGA